MTSAKPFWATAICIIVIVCITWQLQGTRPVDHRFQFPRPLRKAESDTDTHISDQKLYMDKMSQKEAEMKARARHLQERCKVLEMFGVQSTSSQEVHYDHLLVDKKHKALFCPVPKVASTNLRRVLFYTTGLASKETVLNMSPHDIYKVYNKRLVRLRDFSNATQKQMLKSYRKYLFVRQPLAKLLSGFKNKFLHEKDIERNIYYYNVKLFYEKFPTLGKKRNFTFTSENKAITFTDFLTVLTDMYAHGWPVNVHFARASDQCSPCKVSYDFIGKYESLDEDTDFIFDKLGFDIQLNSSNKATRTADILQETCEKVPKPLLQKVMKIESIDYELFGYPIPDWAS